jgi:hypothetical protein
VAETETKSHLGNVVQFERVGFVRLEDAGPTIRANWAHS